MTGPTMATTAPAGVLVAKVAASGDRLAIAAVAPSGVHASVLSPDDPEVATWWRLASPASPLSRDVAVWDADGTVEVAWSDARRIDAATIGVAPVDGVLAPGRPQPLVTTDGTQPRYPLSLAPGGSGVLWSDDQRALHLARAGSTEETDPIPVVSPCYGRERLVALDGASNSEDRAIVAAVTDRGRVLVAFWLANGGSLHWRSAAVPVGSAVAVASVGVGHQLLVIVATNTSRVFVTDVAEPWPWLWHSLGRVGDPPGTERCTGIAAACTADQRVWLVAALEGEMSLAEMSRGPGHSAIGASRCLSKSSASDSPGPPVRRPGFSR